MDGFLSTLPWSTLTPGGIVTLFIVFIGIGWLVPKKFYDEKVLEVERWREAHAVSEKTRGVAIAQVSVLARALDHLSGQRDLGATLISNVQAEKEES